MRKRRKFIPWALIVLMWIILPIAVHDEDLVWAIIALVVLTVVKVIGTWKIEDL